MLAYCSTMLTLAEIHADYAKRLGHESLTDSEKKQAFLNAVIEGKRVEPFATFTDLMTFGIECDKTVLEQFAEWLDNAD